MLLTILYYYIVLSLAFTISSYFTVFFPAKKLAREIKDDNTLADLRPVRYLLIWFIFTAIVFPIMLPLSMVKTHREKLINNIATTLAEAKNA